MKKILVLCSCVLVFICSSCMKKISDGALSDSAFIKVGDPSSSTIEYDNYKVLLYEGNSKDVKILSKDDLEAKTFKPGTEVKIGIVFYKDGKEVAKTDDSKSKCSFTEAKLKAGDNNLEVLACRIEGDGNVIEQENTKSNCKGSIQDYKMCSFNEEIANNNSFYSEAIGKIGTCSSIVEIICKPKDGGKSMVWLACSSKENLDKKDGNYCQSSDKELILDGFKRTAVKINEVKIL